jgi:hypothetical protein
MHIPARFLTIGLYLLPALLLSLPVWKEKIYSTGLLLSAENHILYSDQREIHISQGAMEELPPGV